MKSPINIQEAAPLFAIQLLAQALLLSAGLSVVEAVVAVTSASMLAPVFSARARHAYQLAFLNR